MSEGSIRRASAADVAAMAALLDANELPASNLEEATAWVHVRDAEIAGCVALETYDDTGLLRSLVVREDARRTGIAGELVRIVMDEARARRLRRIVLLTLTARGFFERHGFAVTTRESVVGPVTASWEFRHHGCDGAEVMTADVER